MSGQSPFAGTVCSNRRTMFVFSRLLKELRLDCTVKNGAKISPSFFFHRSTIFSPVNWSVFFFFSHSLHQQNSISPGATRSQSMLCFFFSLWFFLPVLHSCLTAPVLLLLSLHTVVFIPQTSPQSWSVVVRVCLHIHADSYL